MVKTKLVKAAGRFGARYGRRIKRKIADIESKQRKKQLCPFCNKKAKRLSKGIWQCKKCKKKFAGHAYYLEKGAIAVKLKKPELQQEAQELEKAEKTKEKESKPKTRAKTKTEPKTVKTKKAKTSKKSTSKSK